MPYLRNRNWTLWVALIVAYLFAAQSLLAGFSTAAQALSTPRDVFGNVLCAPSHATPDQSSDHSDRAQCCAMACASAASISAPPANIVSLAPPTLVFNVAFEGRIDQIVAPLTRTQHKSRAPPYAG